MTNQSGQPGEDGSAKLPNASPELNDAIRSIDAIGENAWGKDDDEDSTRNPRAEDGEPGESEQP
jgi:hypothetical protein